MLLYVQPPLPSALARRFVPVTRTSLVPSPSSVAPCASVCGPADRQRGGLSGLLRIKLLWMCVHESLGHAVSIAPGGTSSSGIDGSRGQRRFKLRRNGKTAFQGGGPFCVPNGSTRTLQVASTWHCQAPTFRPFGHCRHRMSFYTSAARSPGLPR